MRGGGEGEELEKADGEEGLSLGLAVEGCGKPGRKGESRGNGKEKNGRARRLRFGVHAFFASGSKKAADVTPSMLNMCPNFCDVRRSTRYRYR